MRIRFSKSLAYLSESYSGALSLYETPGQSSILSQSGFPTTGYDDPIHSTKIKAQRLHDKAILRLGGLANMRAALFPFIRFFLCATLVSAW